MVAQPIRIDWTTEEVTEFEAKKPGKYHAKITDGEQKVSANDNPYLMIEFTFQPPESGKAWTNITLIPKTLWRVRQFLVATGQFEESELEGDNFTFTVDDLLGSDVILVTTVETYEGKERTRVKDVLAFDESLIGSDDW